MNKQAAKEWLTKAWHDLRSAQILYDANHYTDSIGVDLHYCVEKILKSFLAYKSSKIPKSHDLIEIYKLVSASNFIFLDDNLFLLKQITKYHIEESYPAFNRPLPSREEIKEVLEFSNNLFYNVCKILSVDIEGVNS